MDGGRDLARKTILSEDRLYQYAICIDVNPSRAGMALFCGPAPSVTDPLRDGPLIRRYTEFTRRWGYGRLCIVNLFAYRCVDPTVLDLIADPIGPQNNDWLRHMALEASICIAAWGRMGSCWERATSVLPLLGQVKCLGRTRDGSPRSPIVARTNTRPIPYERDAGRLYE